MIIPTDNPLSINIKGKLLDFCTPRVMGVINITPDSFFLQSRSNTEKDILDKVGKAIEQGASIVDVGGYSSRPNADNISAKEEQKRLDFALQIICSQFPDVIISIDTFRAEIIDFSVKNYGISIINDISGGMMDSRMFETAAKWQIPYVLSHIQGTPQTMQHNPSYEKFIPEILFYFSEKINQLKGLGVKDIILDPGFGFGKTLEQNYALINNLDVFKVFELPILVGISRKSMIQKVLQTTAEQSLNGTTVLNTLLIQKGANILRVHDVAEAMEIVRITEKLKEVQYDF